MARHGYAPSVSSESSGGSRSSSRSSLSSTSSTRTRVSEVTQKQIKPEGWRQKMLMYTACTNPKRPMAVRRSTIEVYADDFGDGNDDASISSELLDTYYTYAWISYGGWYDGASVASSSSSSKHGGGSTRAKRERYAAHQRRQAPPPPRQAPPPPGPRFMGSAPPPPPPPPAHHHQHPAMDPGAEFFDFDDGHLDADPGFVDLGSMGGPPPPPPSGGGNPGFINLNTQGGGAPGAGKPGKYDDWDD